MGTTEDERRDARRVDAIVVVELSAGEDKASGLSRNVSDRGLLVATQRRFDPGDRLEVTIHSGERSARAFATVVRVDEASPDEIWRYRLALRVEGTIPEEFIVDGARAAARLRGDSILAPNEV